MRAALRSQRGAEDLHSTGAQLSTATPPRCICSTIGAAAAVTANMQALQQRSAGLCTGERPCCANPGRAVRIAVVGFETFQAPGYLAGGSSIDAGWLHWPAGLGPAGLRPLAVRPFRSSTRDCSRRIAPSITCSAGASSLRLPQQLPESLGQHPAVQLVVSVYNVWQHVTDRARDAVMKWMPSMDKLDAQVRNWVAWALHRKLQPTELAGPAAGPWPHT